MKNRSVPLFCIFLSLLAFPIQSLHAELAVYNITSSGNISGGGVTLPVVSRGFMALDLTAKEIATVVYAKSARGYFFSTVSGGWKVQSFTSAGNVSQTIASYVYPQEGFEGYTFLKGANSLVGLSQYESPVPLAKALRGNAAADILINGTLFFTQGTCIATFNKAKTFQLNGTGTSLAAFVTAEENFYKAKGYFDGSLR